MIYGDEKSLSFSRSLPNRRIFFVAERRPEFSRGFQPTGRRDHSSPVASATIEPGWRIAHTHNLRRNQSLALALVLVGSIVATRRGKYLTRNRGLKPTAKFIRPLRGGRNRAEVKSFDDKMSDPAAPANPSGAAQPNIDCDYANRIGRCIGESRSPVSVLQKNQRSHAIISKEIREFCDTAALERFSYRCTGQ